MRRIEHYFIFAIFLATALPAQAAVSAQEKTLPAVEVTGKQGATSLTVLSKADALRDLRRVPGGTSLVDSEDYKIGRSSTLQDTLGYVPGVFAQSRFGAEEARLSIRGSGIQRTFHLRGIKLLQDGIPINQADGGGDFQMIEPLALDYTEVYRGANALQYGGTTLGGAINFVSPTGYDAALLQGRFEVGSYNYLRGQISSGAVVGPVDYFVSLSEFYQDGFRNHSDQDAKRLFSNYGLRITDQLETRFYVTAVDSRSKLPGNLTSAQMNQNPAQNAAANVTGNQKRDFDLIRIANKTTLQLEDQRFEFGSYYIHKDLFHPIFQVLDVLYHDFGFSTRYVNEKDLFDHKNRFVVGFSPVFGLVSDTRSTNVGGSRGDQTARNRQTSYNLDLFAEEQFYVLPQLALVSGLQWSFASREVRDRFTRDGDYSAHPTYKEVTPKVGLIYDLTETSQLYTNFSRSFEPPSFGELTNLTGGRINDLNAQTASTIELGTRGSEGPVSWDLAWYYSWVENELLGLNDAAGNPLGTINAGQTIHQGIEAGFEVELLKGILPSKWNESINSALSQLEVGNSKLEEKVKEDRLKLRNAYTWSRFRFDGDQAYSDNPLPAIPEHFLRTELVYEHPSGFYVGPNLEWVMKKYAVDMANTLFTDPYATLGVKGGFRVNEGLWFFVEGRNLTNEIYAATTGVIADARGRDSAQFLPGDGRSLYAGMEFRWG